MGEAFIICLHNGQQGRFYVVRNQQLLFGIRHLGTPYRATIKTYPAPVLCGSTEPAAAGAVHKHLRLYKQTKLAKAAASIKLIEA